MQLLFYLVYYHSTCFGRGSRPSSGVIHKTAMAATSVCHCMWGEVVLSLVVCVHWIWVQCGLGVHEDSVAWCSSFLHYISAFLRVTMLLLYYSFVYYSWRCTRTASETCRVIINQVKQKLHLVGYLLIQYFKDARYHEHKISFSQKHYNMFNNVKFATCFGYK